jgi:putative membrane protein
MWDHMGDGWWGMGGSGMLLWWVLLGAGFALLVRYATRPGKGEEEPKSPLEILDERYARGEMGHEEYEQKKHDLQG